MKVKEFLEKLELAYKLPNKYQSGGWGKYDGSKWGWDCNNLGKGIIWGWVADTSKPRGGGAVYASNGLGDIGTEQMIAKCNNVSNNFENIKQGELLWLQGHVGYYIGDGQVIEATAGWDTWKVIKSQVGKDGSRTYNGKGGSAKWQKHGFMPWIDYTEEPSPQPEPIPEPKPSSEFKVGDKVKPIKLVNWQGTQLKQYDDIYTIMGIDGRGAILGANRNGKLEVWAVLTLDNIKKI